MRYLIAMIIAVLSLMGIGLFLINLSPSMGVWIHDMAALLTIFGFPIVIITAVKKPKH